MTESPPTTRSARTRARIADAARALFAEAGVTATSVRDIAERAECDPALVIRYFGSKEALFTAVVQFDLMLPELRGLTPGAAAERLAGHFVRIWETRESGEKFQTLLRSATSHEPSAERLRAVFAGQVQPVIAAFCGEGASAGDTAAKVASVVLGVALGRYILRLPPLTGIAPERLPDLIATSLEPILAAGLPARLQPREDGDPSP